MSLSPSSVDLTQSTDSGSDEEIVLPPHPLREFAGHSSREEDEGDEKREGNHGGGRKSEEQANPGFMSTLAGLFRACGILCAIGCPPVPELIARKLAFHPPDHTYGIYAEDDPDTSLEDASELGLRRLIVQPYPFGGFLREEYDTVMARSRQFTVRTKHGNTLVCLHAKTRRVADGALARQVVIFAQPNSSDLGSFMQPQGLSFAALADIFHMDVYGFDYSGYGRSSGTPSEKNTYADIRAVYDFVRQTRKDKKICLMGYSIGTCVVADLAAKRVDSLSGVVLIAPLTSGLRLVGGCPEQEESCFLDRFTTTDKVRRITVPVLVVHGSDDTVIPMDHALELHKRLPNPVTPLFVHGADHMTIFNGANIEVFRRIQEFLRCARSSLTINVIRINPI